MNKITFIQKSTNKHGPHAFGYDTIPDDAELLTDRCDRVDITCTKCGHTFNVAVAAHLYKKHGCRKCYDNATSARLTKNTSWFIDEATKVHNGAYDYSDTHYVGTKNKVTIICKHHGPFLQTPNDHLTGYGCPQCGTNKVKETLLSTTEDFIIKATKVHGQQYQYDKTVYTGTHRRVTVTCPNHGDFIQKANSHLSGCGCPTCKTSKGEIAVKQWLEQFNIPYLYQHRVVNNGQVLYLDFVVGNKVIEIDGIQHYQQNGYFHKKPEDFRRQQYRDNAKNEYCTDNNLSMHRILYTGRNIEDVINNISHILQVHVK